MNPIRIIPFKYTNQPMCPQCFGEIEPYQLSQKRKNLFKCKECGQLFCHPDNMEPENEDVIFLTVRTYFKYRYLKNCIINACYNIKTKRLDKNIRCNINGQIYETSADTSVLNSFFETNNIEKIYKLDITGYTATSSREVVYVSLSHGGKEKNIKGNLDLIEIIPRMDVILYVVFRECHDIVRMVLDKQVLKIM